MLMLSPSMGLIVNTLIYLPLTLWLLTVPYTGHSREGAAPTRRALSWGDAFNVVREVSGNRPIITMVILGGSASLFIGNAVHTQMPEFAHDLGANADFAYSSLLTASAAGAVFGGFLLEGKGWLKADVKTAIICATLWCVALGSFAFSSNYYLSLGLLFIAGMLNLSFYSTAQSIVQLLSPNHLRGRLIGLFTMSAFGLRAFSGVTIGVVGGLIGIHWSLAISAMALFTVTLALLAFASPARNPTSSGSA